VNQAVRTHRRFLLQTGFWFLLFSLPALAFRWWNPEPLAGFSDRKYRWMSAILRQAPPVRVGLVGSSKIWAAIDAPRISEALYDRPDAVVNFGTIWTGRGRDYVVARQLIDNLPTLEILVLEVGRSEREKVHPYFHRLASLAESFADPLNRLDTPPPRRRGWQHRITFWVTESLGNTVAGYAQVLERLGIYLDKWTAVGSYWEQTGGSMRDHRVMESQRRRMHRRSYRVDSRKRGARYVARIAQLCEDRDVQLVLVEVPVYRQRSLGREYRAYLEGLGAPVLSIEARRELYVRSNWFDQGHMNIHGAALFSDWFVEELDPQLIDSSLFD
jgi:hypothetical protein